MRRLIPKSFVLLLILVAAGTLQAETIIPAKLSLADAISISLGVNVNLKSAVQMQKASVSRLHIAELNTSHSVGSNVNLQHSPTSTGYSQLVYSDLNYANPFGTSAVLRLSPLGMGGEFGSVGLLVKHPLMKGKGPLSERGSQILGAKSDVVVSEYSLYESRQATVMGVIEAYYRAVLSQEQVKVQERALTIAQEIADGTRKREAEGLMTGIQVTRADINVARTRDALNLEKQSARGAVDHVMLAMGSGIGQAVELADTLPETAPESPSIEEAIKTAVVKRTELKATDQRIANQARNLAMREDAFRPDLSAVVRFDSTSTSKGLISGSLFDLGSSVLGLSLSLPLDTRALRQNRDIAQRDLEILRERQNFQTDEITDEVRRAHRAFESAKVSLDIYSRNLATAEEGLYLAQRMVEEGEGSNRDILDAQQGLSDVQSGVLSAKVDLYLAAVRLKYAMGEDLTGMGSK